MIGYTKRQAGPSLWPFAAEGLGFQFPNFGRGLPPQEMQDAIGLEMQTHANQLTVRVEDSLFAVSGDVPGWSFELPLDGSERSVVQDSTGVEFSVSLTWRDGTPVVQRSFGEHGAVFDAYAIAEDDVLVVTRTARMGAQASKGTLQYVYVRSGLTGSGRRQDQPDFSATPGSRSARDRGRSVGGCGDSGTGAAGVRLPQPGPVARGREAGRRGSLHTRFPDGLDHTWTPSPLRTRGATCSKCSRVMPPHLEHARLVARPVDHAARK